MMVPITVENLRFNFPDGWQASKLDDWSFYRNQFQRLSGIRLVCGEDGCGKELKTGMRYGNTSILRKKRDAAPLQ